MPPVIPKKIYVYMFLKNRYSIYFDRHPKIQSLGTCNGRFGGYNLTFSPLPGFDPQSYVCSNFYLIVVPPPLSNPESAFEQDGGEHVYCILSMLLFLITTVFCFVYYYVLFIFIFIQCCNFTEKKTVIIWIRKHLARKSLRK